MFCRMKPFVEEGIDWGGFFGQCIGIVIKKFFDDKQGAVGDAYWPGIQPCANIGEDFLYLKNICYFTERPGEFFFNSAFPAMVLVWSILLNRDCSSSLWKMERSYSVMLSISMAFSSC